MINNVGKTAANPGFCDTVYNTGASGFNWLKVNGKAIAGSIGDKANTVWRAVSTFFTTVAAKTRTFLFAAKDTVSSAFTATMRTVRDAPKETKVVAAIGMLLTAAFGALIYRSCANDTATTIAVTEIDAVNGTAEGTALELRENTVVNDTNA